MKALLAAAMTMLGVGMSSAKMLEAFYIATATGADLDRLASRSTPVKSEAGFWSDYALKYEARKRAGLPSNFSSLPKKAKKKYQRRKKG
jgi:hypothetical protein